MCNCNDCVNSNAQERLDELAHRIHQIHCDLKSRIPKIRAQYNLDEVISELNEMVGEKE